MIFLGLNLIPNASSKEKKEKFYISLKFYFFKWIVSEKPAPVKGEKVSLKIHRADLRDREICPTGRLFLLYVCNMV